MTIEEQRLAGIRVSNLREDKLRDLARLLNVQGYEQMEKNQLKKEIKRRQQRILRSYGVRKPAL